MEDLLSLCIIVRNEHFQIELAFDYYSLLLDQCKLDVQGIENIARLYIRENNNKEASLFLKQAIILYPNYISLYTMYFEVTPRPDPELIKKFNINSPNYIHLSIYRNIN